MNVEELETTLQKGDKEVITPIHLDATNGPAKLVTMLKSCTINFQHKKTLKLVSSDIVD